MLVSFNLLKSLYPQAEITVFSNNSINNKDANTREGYNKYINSILRQEVKIIDWTYRGHFDLIFHGGGGVYFDNKKGPVLYNAINRIIKWFGINSINKLDLIIRQITGKQQRIKYERKIGVGIGVGPFHRSSKLFYQKVAELGSFSYMNVRDQFSYDLLSSLKFKQKLNISTDLSFHTELWITHQTIAPINRDRSKIGIILKGRTEKIHIHYKNLAKDLENQGITVQFFAFDENYDLDYIDRMKPEYDVNIWEPHKNTIDEYMKELWTCSICITDRAHGAMLGAIGNVIPLIIRTSRKSDQVQNILNLDNALSMVGYNKFYKLDDIIKVQNDQENLSAKIQHIVRNNKKVINMNINSMVSI